MHLKRDARISLFAAPDFNGLQQIIAQFERV